jgi:hypothetical protein
MQSSIWSNSDAIQFLFSKVDEALGKLRSVLDKGQLGQFTHLELQSNAFIS